MIKLKYILNNWVIVLITLSFFGCQKQNNNLPILSKYVDDTGNMIEYTIDNFNFKDQLGQSFSKVNTEGKIYIANFFFTRCGSICPPMTIKLIELSNIINHEDFFISSFSIDPDYDTEAALLNYTKQTGISHDKWKLLNGSKQELEHIAKLFRTSFKPIENTTDFYHSSYVALVDKKQRIRGFYDILKQEEFDKLIEDSNSLLY